MPRDARNSKLGNFTSLHAKDGLNIRTLCKWSPKWDRTRNLEYKASSVGMPQPLQPSYGKHFEFQCYYLAGLNLTWKHIYRRHILNIISISKRLLLWMYDMLHFIRTSLIELWGIVSKHKIQKENVVSPPGIEPATRFETLVPYNFSLDSFLVRMRKFLVSH